MQKYDNKSKKANPFKDFVLEALDVLRFKLENNKLTLSEWEALARIIGEQLPLLGSLDDLAAYYDKPKENVKVVISRKLNAKPIRRILYPFLSFIKVVPERWKERRVTRTEL